MLNLTWNLRKHQWCSGNINAFQAFALGSIPGWCISFAFCIHILPLKKLLLIFVDEYNHRWRVFHLLQLVWNYGRWKMHLQTKGKKKERRNTFEKSKTSRHTKGGFRNPRYSVSLVNKICLPEKYPAVASIWHKCTHHKDKPMRNTIIHSLSS